MAALPVRALACDDPGRVEVDRGAAAGRRAALGRVLHAFTCVAPAEAAEPGALWRVAVARTLSGPRGEPDKARPANDHNRASCTYRELVVVRGAGSAINVFVNVPSPWYEQT